MWQDLRYSLRTLTKHPGFLIAGVIVLALGIGVNTAIFSVVNAILFRPLPVHKPEELRYVYGVSRRAPRLTSGVAYRHFVEMRQQTDVFSDVLLMSTVRDKVRVAGNVDQAQGELVSSNYFEVLGVKPLLGRGFVWSDDEAVNAAPVAVISHDLWKARFLGDPAVLGKSIDLSMPTFSGSYVPWRPYTIVGVMPAGFKGVSNPWDSTQYWVPFLRRQADMVEEQRRTHGSRIPPQMLDPQWRSGLPIGRVRPGLTLEQTSNAVGIFGERIRREAAPNITDWQLTVADSRRIRLPFDPGGQIVPGRLATALMAVSGVLLLIAAANLAGMLLARGVTRRSELAVRLALGAGRWRLTRQLVSESLLLSLAGGALGLVLARWLVDLFIAGTPSRFVRWHISALALDVPLDWRVILVTVASCVITGLVVGLVPARQAMKTDLLSGLAGQAAGSTRNLRAPLRHVIVIPQVCLSLVLLLIAGVLARTIIQSEMVDPGFNPDGVVLLDYEMPIGQTYLRPRPERIERSLRILERAAAAPGVTVATVAMTQPMLMVPLPSMHGWFADREGFKPDGRHFWAAQEDITASYFDTLRIPLVRGRGFDDHRDRANAPNVAIVSEDFARGMWPDRDPIGQHLAQHWPDSTYPPVWREVVGVARNVRPPLSDDNWSPAVYIPFQQSSMAHSYTVAARGTIPPAELIERLRTAIREAEPEALAVNARMMRDGIGELLYPRRVAAAILGLAGAIGLLLASMGLYGVISYSVAQRVREIGVRMALGAERPDIVRLIVREGLKVTIVGVGLGFVLTYTAIRVISRTVVQMPSMDVLTFCAVPALLGAVVLLACYVPALRAARVDPMVVLRGL